MPAEDPAAPDQFKDSQKTASDVINSSRNNQSGSPTRAPESSLEKSFNDAISDDLIGQLSEELEEMALDLRSGASLAEMGDKPMPTRMLSQQIFQAADSLLTPPPPKIPAGPIPGPNDASLSDGIDDAEFGFEEPAAQGPDSNKLNSLLSKAFVPRPAAKEPAASAPERPVSNGNQPAPPNPFAPLPASPPAFAARSAQAPGASTPGQPTPAAQTTRPIPASQTLQPTSAAQTTQPTSAAQTPQPTSVAQTTQPTPAAQTPQPTPSAQPQPTPSAQPQPTPSAQTPQPTPAASAPQTALAPQTPPAAQISFPTTPPPIPLPNSQPPSPFVQQAPTAPNPFAQASAAPNPFAQAAAPPNPFPQNPLPPDLFAQAQSPPNSFPSAPARPVDRLPAPGAWQDPPQPADPDDWSTPVRKVQPLSPGAAFGRTKKENNNEGTGKHARPAQAPVPGDEPINLPTYANAKYRDPAPNTIPPGAQQQAYTGLAAVPKGYRSQPNEDTALVMPHVAPQPEPDQNISEQFAKSVPGMTPANDPSKQILTPPSNRRAKDRPTIEVRERKQLPARVERPQQQTQGAPRVPDPPKREAQRDSRTVTKMMPNPGGFRNLRGRDGEPPLQFLRQNWRFCVLGIVALMMLVSCGIVISIYTKSLSSSLGMSASQKEGKEAFKDHMYDQAVRYFNEAIQRDPNNPDLYRDRASAHLALQEYQQAVSDCTNVIKLKGDADLGAAYLDRAAAYFWLGRYDKSVDDYEELIKLRPNDADAYFGRGLANFKLRHYADALADYKRVVSLKPDKDQVYEYMGNVEVEQGDFGAAVKSYSQALQLNSRDANACYMRGVAESRLQRYSDAARDLSTAIALQSGRIEFWNDRGFTFLQQGRYKDAIEDFATALELNPQFGMARQNRSNACNKFIDSLKSDLQHNAKDVKALADLAFCYDNLEDYALAIDSANKALAVDGKNVTALIARANAELRQKRYTAALTDANKALQVSPDDVNAYLVRARVYLHVGQYSNAVEDYTRCLQDERAPLYALRERALAHLLANDGTNASVDAREFLKKNGWGNGLSGSAALISWLSQRQLQDIDGANGILNEAQTHLRPTQWPYPIFKYLKRDITLSQLSALANNDRELTDLKLWSAFNLLLNGKKQEAAQSFAWVRHNGFQGDEALLAQNR